MIKLIIVSLVLVFTVFAVVVYLINMPIITAGVATGNQSATVNVTNYFGYVEVVNSLPWIGLFAILFIGGGGAIWLMIKL